MIGKEDGTLGALIHDVAHSLRTLIDREVEPYNLTRAKWLALGILDRKDGLTQTELANELELGVATVGRLIDRLEERGFVERRSSPEDRRTNVIFIRQSARPQLEELEGIAADVRTKALEGLSKADQKKLLKLLERIKQNLSTNFASSSALIIPLIEPAHSLL